MTSYPILKNRIQDFLIVIPARGGSKRIKKKNLINLGNKKLIEISLYKFRRFIKNVYVNTDDEIISKIAKNSGANVIKRDRNLCGDKISTEKILLSSLDYLRINQSLEFRWILTHQVTSPFIKIQTISKFINLTKKKNNYNSFFTVNIEKADLWQKNNSKLQRVFSEEPRRQQNRKPLFYENSALYLTKVKKLYETKFILPEKRKAVLISKIEGFDINTKEDLFIARSIYQKKAK